jgi:hypothetical protein
LNSDETGTRLGNREVSIELLQLIC